MTDYKSLVESLREEADAVSAIEWEIPICTSNHIKEAADAIERLQKERDEAVRDIKKYSSNCKTCLHGNNGKNDCLENKFAPCEWEWRGVRDD